MSCDSNTSMPCPCTYSSCSRRGQCCACIAYHTRSSEFPACFFSKGAEKAYDRSYRALVKDRGA